MVPEGTETSRVVGAGERAEQAALVDPGQSPSALEQEQVLAPVLLVLVQAQPEMELGLLQMEMAPEREPMQRPSELEQRVPPWQATFSLQKSRQRAPGHLISVPRAARPEQCPLMSQK